MRNRFLALILAVVTALTICLPAAMAESLDSEGYYYVYTENGKTLNVRATPGGEVVGHLKYGSRIYCYYKDGGNGWALIDYTYDMPGVGVGTYACFVSSRFLVKNKPAAKTKSSTADSSATTAAAAETGSVDDMNAEFRSAKRVAEYTVYARPTRVSGWVNMRWAPSKSAEVQGTYKSNAALVVVAELNNWLQVEDPETGNIGFVDKNFVN